MKISKSALSLILLSLFTGVLIADDVVLKEDFSGMSAGEAIETASGWTPAYFDEPASGWTWGSQGGRTVAKFAPPNPPGQGGASLTKTFPEIDDSGVTLTVAVDAGFAAGTQNQEASYIGIALLNAEGNGYAFVSRRTSGPYAYQYAKVIDGQLNTSSYHNIAGDTQQMPGSLERFTITRTPAGFWTFAKEGSDAVEFDDPSFGKFDRIVLFSQSGAASGHFPPIYGDIEIKTAK